MKYKTVSSLALATLGITAIAPMVNAGIARDSYKGDVYVTGLNPYAELLVTYQGIPKTKTITASECGFVKLSLNAIQPPATFDGSPVPSLSSIPLVAKADLPKCVNGAAQNVPAGGVLRYLPTSDSDPTLMWTGKTPFTQYDAVWNIGKERKVKANACGVARLSNSGAYLNAPGDIRINATNHTISTLPSFAAPPGCKNNTLLLPVGFPN